MEKHNTKIEKSPENIRKKRVYLFCFTLAQALADVKLST